MNLPNSSFLEKIDTIIADNFHDEHFSIEDLAKQVNFSYPHTYRKIKEETGFTPFVYIRQKRLACACDLLTSTKLSMAEIAHRIGFNNQNYFSKCFSENYGCTPSTYRRQG